MFKILYIALFILPMNLIAQLSNFEWAKSFDVSSSHISSAIITDSSNNVYFCGRYEDTLDADPSSGVYNLISNGGYDIFVIKLDQNGNLVWGVSLGGAGWEDCLDMDIDSNQNIYLGGSYDETMDFDPGTGVNIVTCPANTNKAYILKLDSDANFLWVKTLSTSISGISVDINNNLCITGNFYTTTDFDPGPGSFSVSPVYSPISAPGMNADNIFVLKLGSNGDFTWVKTLSSQRLLKSNSIETDNFGNILFTGTFDGGPIDFDPGPTFYYDSVQANTFIAFKEKLDRNGNFEWLNVLHSTSSNSCSGVSFDSDGNSYFSGQYFGIVDIDPGPVYTPMGTNGGSDIYIQKIDPNGTLVWAKNVGGIGCDGGTGIHVNGGKVYVTGIYYNSADFNPNAGIEMKVSNGSNDGFVLCLDTSSNFNWVKSIGGSYSDYVNNIVTDKLNNIYFDGLFQDTVDLHPDFPKQIEVSNSIISPYVEKLNRCLIKPNVEVVDTCGSFTWINSVTYTEDEIISINLTNAGSGGCDSLLQLHLTIGNTESTNIISACNSYTWIDGNTYTVSNNTATYFLTGSSGCDSVVTLNLTINAVSDLSTSVNGSMISANNPDVNYQWIDCLNDNNTISGANVQTYNATSIGEYAVIITENECTDTSACVFINNVGLEEYQADHIFLYPNPSTGSFTINIGNLIDPELNVYSLNGSLIYKKEHIKDPFFHFKLDETEGIYFVELKDSSRTLKFKLVKL